jgi:hypothetical protein
MDILQAYQPASMIVLSNLALNGPTDVMNERRDLAFAKKGVNVANPNRRKNAEQRSGFSFH